MNEHLPDELWPTYLDGALGANQRAAVDAHLTQCAACRVDLEVHRALRRRLGGLATSLAVQGDASDLDRPWAAVRPRVVGNRRSFLKPVRSLGVGLAASVALLLFALGLGALFRSQAGMGNTGAQAVRTRIVATQPVAAVTQGVLSASATAATATQTAPPLPPATMTHAPETQLDATATPTPFPPGLATATPTPAEPYTLTVQMSVSAQPGASAPGGGLPVLFNIELFNLGSGAAAQVRITNTIPAPLTYLEGSALGGAVYQPEANAVIWMGVIEGQTAHTIEFTCVVPEPQNLRGTVVSNQVVVDDGLHPSYTRSLAVNFTPWPTIMPTPGRVPTQTPWITATPSITPLTGIAPTPWDGVVDQTPLAPAVTDTPTPWISETPGSGPTATPTFWITPTAWDASSTGMSPWAAPTRTARITPTA